MSFKNLFIEHDISPEVREWINKEIEAQEALFRKVEKAMEDIAPMREKWYQEFFDRITTIGFSFDGDDKVKLDPADLPVKPAGRVDRVVWKHGADGE